MKSPRVLMSAYQCAPGQGSVSQIGWEWYSRTAEKTPVTLITHIRNRVALEAAGAPIAGSEIHYVDTEWFAGPLYRFANRLFPRSQHAVFLLSSIDFYLYDAAALKLARKTGAHWDVVHAVTPVSPIAATRMFRLGPPLVVGPWNGGMESPRGFSSIMRGESGWIYRIRNAGRLLNRLLGCTRNAAVILSATQATDRSVPVAHRRVLKRMVENGVDLRLFQPMPGKSIQPGPLRILFAGRLIPVKGVSMLLEAIARLAGDVDLQLTIVGDGPIRGELEREIEERALSSNVKLTGNLPLADVASLMQNADLLCLPSVRESGGAVLLEAMACSVPTIAVNYGGPAEIVDNEVGHLLSAESPEALISDLVSALRDAALNRDIWAGKGRAGRRRVAACFGWDAKIEQALTIYRQLSSIEESKIA